MGLNAYHGRMRRIAVVVGMALAVLLGAVTPAVAGPGCPDQPGVCPPIAAP
jgi:hypothetical protein